MNTQYLQYVREQLIVATADLSGATKGQLLAWLENAQFDTKTFKRKKPRVMDEVTGEMITLDNPPIPGKQSRAKGSHIPLVNHVEFCTASWRRALMSLEEHQKSWLLWNYSENVSFEHQVAITQWAWSEFREQLGTKKVAGKTMDRLKKLIWLAAQDVKAELAGRETYEYQALAELAGVAKSTWTETYLPHWLEMRNSFKRLDSGALISVTRSRSQQKATNLDVSLAKPN
ncbi:bacteriophage antitermination protein Q [Enterobacter hormaechei]|uniref:bacteriophage antitermination protein Q n=1 Tax=Enterobacter hormaechei TaxID=158836 RepID=UPI001E5EF12F|nr:bacteriophage antitermination protein Q [Enterobacter hormaechei]MCC4568381.1 bacteriophage antitermination protein Q [Enterobacter hormaechei subsp. hoffmannii]MCC4575511.1 bacteriophage antitermination protein Q [Enterobacter hormaechei subsp. hoffmannii]MCC4580056.1 bacteriophage antitermination protein Q [Enterobacter hormaechei subsp. hoffmannii]MCC4582017.1 bacteriophage antitermination protein Q [Enterobacter hormaechei subsp. hoffmannii]MCE1614689.1 bacteriophage antitermination pro